MAHWAKVYDGVVTQVICADASYFDNFVDDTPGTWLQTSYNTRGGVYYIPNTNTPDPDQSKAFRKNYAGVGYLYITELDAFAPPKPYASWTLNPQTCYWESPVPYPDDGKYYRWDEQSQTWVLVTS